MFRAMRIKSQEKHEEVKTQDGEKIRFNRFDQAVRWLRCNIPDHMVNYHKYYVEEVTQ